MGWIFGIRQRRAMGLSFRDVRKLLEEMGADGDLGEKTNAELAVEVLGNAVNARPAVFRDAAIDWDKLLAFLEKLIPLILKIIALFG